MSASGDYSKYVRQSTGEIPQPQQEDVKKSKLMNTQIIQGLTRNVLEKNGRTPQASQESKSAPASKVQGTFSGKGLQPTESNESEKQASESFSRNVKEKAATFVQFFGNLISMKPGVKKTSSESTQKTTPKETFDYQKVWNSTYQQGKGLHAMYHLLNEDYNKLSDPNWKDQLGISIGSPKSKKDIIEKKIDQIEKLLTPKQITKKDFDDLGVGSARASKLEEMQDFLTLEGVEVTNAKSVLSQLQKKYAKLLEEIDPSKTAQTGHTVNNLTTIASLK